MSQWISTISSSASLELIASSVVALAGLGLRCVTRNALPSIIVALAGFWALENVVTTAWQAVDGPIHRFAWSCAAMSLWWAVVAAFDARLVCGRLGRQPNESRFTVLARVAALLLGVTAAIILCILLSMQGIYVLADLYRGYTIPGFRAFGLDNRGLWPIAFLTAALIMAFWSNPDRRLPACLVLCAAMLTTWLMLLQPVYRPDGFERTATLLFLCLSQAGVLFVSTWLLSWRMRRAGLASAGTEPEDLHSVSVRFPGVTTCLTGLCVLVAALTTYHLLVPITLPIGGATLPPAILAVSSVLAAISGLNLLRLKWSPYLADATLTLGSLTLCSLVMLFVPEEPAALADRYPMIFNAIMIGLTISAALCVRTAQLIARQSGARKAPLFETRLAAWLKRFAFFNAALALVAATMMAIWPQLPAIAAMDDSLGRVAVGTATNLALVMVLIWCSRRLRRSSIHALTVLALLATGAFVVIRMLPFASRIG